jgi:hypothetical protein
MNRWSELHRKAQSVGANRGLSRLLRDLKRQEAEFRNESVDHESTRTHRHDRCGCTTDAAPSGRQIRQSRRRTRKP